MSATEYFIVCFFVGLAVAFFLGPRAYRSGFSFTGAPKNPIEAIRENSTGERNPFLAENQPTRNFTQAFTIPYPSGLSSGSYTVYSTACPQTAMVRKLKRDIESSIGNREDLT